MPRLRRSSRARAAVALGLMACSGAACTKNGAARPSLDGDARDAAGTDAADLPGSGGAPGGSGGATAMLPGTGGMLGANGGAAGELEPSGAEGGYGGIPVAGSGGAAAEPTDAGAPAPLDEGFAAMARQIAADYVSWGRVDDELRWAPWLCRIPLPGIVRPSESNDATTHGQKLYSVFAKNHDAYPAGPQEGQVIVKQSWTAELVTTPGAAFAPASARFAPDAGDHFYGYAQRDGGVYRAAELAGLYIMFRVDPATPDTDEGWVYATITAAGQVTAAGRVASCMGCHEVATHERLFGVPLSPTLPN